MISTIELLKLKKEYPKGIKIKLLKMEDSQAPPIGTIGIVQGVDDIGNVLVSWENDSSLSIIVGVDEIEIIK